MSIRSAARNLRRAIRNASSGVERWAWVSVASARCRRVVTGAALQADVTVSRVQHCALMLQKAQLNILDELYMHLDREDEPFSVHMEVQVDGRVDGDRLRSAVVEAAQRHPIA